MGPTGLCLLLLAAAPAEQPFTVDVGGRFEAAVGTNIGQSAIGTVDTSWLLEPDVLVQDRWSRGRFVLEYRPWILYTPTVTLHDVLVLNRISATLLEELTPNSGIFVTSRMWIGDQAFSPVVTPSTLAPIGQPPTGPSYPGQLPTVRALSVIDSETRAGYHFYPIRNLRLQLEAGYVYSEGANPASRLQLPLQRGPLVEVRADYAMSVRDQLIPTFRTGLLSYGPVFRPAGSVEGGVTVLLPHFQTGLAVEGTEAALRWVHQATPLISWEVAGGLGVLWRSSSTDLTTGDLVWIRPGIPVPGGWNVYPIAGLRARQVVPLVSQVLEFSEAAALAPIIDRFSATVVQRLQATITGRYGFVSRWALETQGTAVVGIDATQLDVRAEVKLTWQPVRHLQISAGTRLAYVDYPVVGNVPQPLNGFSWVAFLAITTGTMDPPPCDTGGPPGLGRWCWR